MQQRPQDMSALHTTPGATGLLGHMDRVLPKGVLNRSEDECSQNSVSCQVTLWAPTNEVQKAGKKQ